MTDGISAAQLQKLRKLIKGGVAAKFYSWRVWRGGKNTEGIRNKVIKLDHCQCFYCRKPLHPGEAIVHHVKHLEEAPELALSIYDEQGRRQLVTVCKACHELQHPEALPIRASTAAEPLTAECWE